MRNGIEIIANTGRAVLAGRARPIAVIAAFSNMQGNEPVRGDAGRTQAGPPALEQVLRDRDERTMLRLCRFNLGPCRRVGPGFGQSSVPAHGDELVADQALVTQKVIDQTRVLDDRQFRREQRQKRLN